MNQIEALMLSHGLEADRRRAAVERRTRFLEPEPVVQPPRREPLTWVLIQRHPRFNTAL